MRVVALQLGVWGAGRRRPGEEFEVPDGTRASWFVPVAGYKPPAEGKKEKVVDTLSALSKQGAKASTDLA